MVIKSQPNRGLAWEADGNGLSIAESVPSRAFYCAAPASFAGGVEAANDAILSSFIRVVL